MFGNSDECHFCNFENFEQQALRLASGLCGAATVKMQWIDGCSAGEQLSEISQRPVLVALVGGRGIGFSFQLAIIRHQY